MNCAISLLAFFAASSPTRGQLGTTPTGCRGPTGSTVPQGSAWVAQDGCNVCTCTQYGAQCDSWRDCNNLNHLGHPGDPVCVYGRSEFYREGQTWRTREGCNTCQCTALGMKCTVRPCANAGFSQPKPAGSPRDVNGCRYHDRFYIYGDHFLTNDGCNTCYCIIPGNSGTFPVCTTTPCDLLG